MNKQTVRREIERERDKRPKTGIVHSVDMHVVNLQIRGSPGIIRNVSVIGDITSILVGDEVPIVWDERGRPIVGQKTYIPD